MSSDREPVNSRTNTQGDKARMVPDTRPAEPITAYLKESKRNCSKSTPTIMTQNLTRRKIHPKLTPQRTKLENPTISR